MTFLRLYSSFAATTLSSQIQSQLLPKNNGKKERKTS